MAGERMVILFRDQKFIRVVFVREHELSYFAHRLSWAFETIHRYTSVHTQGICGQIPSSHVSKTSGAERYQNLPTPTHNPTVLTQHPSRALRSCIQTPTGKPILRRVPNKRRCDARTTR